MRKIIQKIVQNTVESSSAQIASRVCGNIQAQQSMMFRALLLEARQLALQNNGQSKINDLASVEFQVFSQWGEDGIIDWLIHALPSIPKIFIEFGVENYQEANTRYLLFNRNWRGLIIDGSEEYMRSVYNEDIHWKYDITPVNCFITKDNINDIFIGSGFSGEIGILSIDIDGNDYWIWDAINAVNPVVVICEYSSVFGDIHPVSIPYDPSFVRHKAHYSGQYAGASIKALIYLSEMKGYTFVGTNSNGVNAFFVRNDYFSEFLTGKISHTSIYCSRFSDTRDVEGNLTYIRGEKRFELFAHLPVTNVVTGKNTNLNELRPLYSNNFLQQVRGEI